MVLSPRLLLTLGEQLQRDGGVAQAVALEQGDGAHEGGLGRGGLVEEVAAEELFDFCFFGGRVRWRGARVCFAGERAGEKARRHKTKATHHHVDALLDGLLQDLLKGAERVLAPDLVLLVDALFGFFVFGFRASDGRRRAMSGGGGGNAPARTRKRETGNPRSSLYSPGGCPWPPGCAACSRCWCCCCESEEEWRV